MIETLISLTGLSKFKLAFIGILLLLIAITFVIIGINRSIESGKSGYDVFTLPGFSERSDYEGAKVK